MTEYLMVLTAKINIFFKPQGEYSKKAVNQCVVWLFFCCSFRKVKEQQKNSKRTDCNWLKKSAVQNGLYQALCLVVLRHFFGKKRRNTEEVAKKWQGKEGAFKGNDHRDADGGGNDSMSCCRV